MWFKSFKAFKENPENKAILLAVARYILFTYKYCIDSKIVEDAENHHWRENFIDKWLAEVDSFPGVKSILPIDIAISRRFIYGD